MSSRTFAAGISLVLATTAASIGLSAVAAGCSSDEDTNVIGADAATDAPLDSPQQRPGPTEFEEAGSATRDVCIAECGVKHPTGRTKDDAIATCWVMKCNPACNGDEPDAGDAGEEPAGDAGPSCQNPVTTDIARCDLCTRTHCCAEWDGCFNDNDCASFNGCVRDCPPE